MCIRDSAELVQAQNDANAKLRGRIALYGTFRRRRGQRAVRGAPRTRDTAHHGGEAGPRLGAGTGATEYGPIRPRGGPVAAHGAAARGTLTQLIS